MPNIQDKQTQKQKRTQLSIFRIRISLIHDGNAGISSNLRTFLASES